MKKYNRILITIISPDFNLMNRYSAVACVIYSFASVLQKNGFEVFVNEKNILDWEKLTVPPAAISASKQSKLFKLMRFFPKQLREMVKDALAILKNRKTINQIFEIPKPDIVISWVTYRDSSGVDFAKKWKTPLIAIYDNPLAEEYAFLNGFKPFFESNITFHEKKILTSANALILYSPAVKVYLDKKYNIKGAVYFNAFTDFLRMQFENQKKDLSTINFAYIGSFFNWHKIDDLIFAFESVNLEYPNCKLYLIGDGPEFNRISSSVKNNNIVFTGKKDGKELDLMMKEIHVGIISNALWFQAPVKFFQYSAANLLVISKKTPTILELSKGEDCYLFFDTKDELKKQMLNVMSNPLKIEQFGEKAGGFIKNNYSEVNYLNFFNEIFESI